MTLGPRAGLGPTLPVVVDTITSHLFVYCLSYTPVEVNKCMRSSGSIAAAAAQAAVQTYNTYFFQTGSVVCVIVQGMGSTVAGPRSQCVLARRWGWSDYAAISRSLNHTALPTTSLPRCSRPT